MAKLGDDTGYDMAVFAAGLVARAKGRGEPFTYRTIRADGTTVEGSIPYEEALKALEEMQQLPREKQPRYTIYPTYLDMVAWYVEQATEADAALKAIPTFDVAAQDTQSKCRKRAYLHEDRIRAYSCLTAVVFAALALEAYINDVSLVYLPNFYRENLDRLDLPAKWVLIPRLAFGGGIEPSDDLIARIAQLQKLRNTLVHARSAMALSRKAAPVAPEIADAKTALNICRDAIAAVDKLAGTSSGEMRDEGECQKEGSRAGT